MKVLKAAYLILDFVIVFSAFLLADRLKFGTNLFQRYALELSLQSVVLYLAFTVLFVLVFRLRYLYRFSVITRRERYFLRILFAMLIGYGAAIIMMFLTKSEHLFERIFLALSFTIMLVLVSLVRLIIMPLVTKAAAKSGALGKKTLVITRGEAWRSQLRTLGEKKNGYFKPVAWIDLDGDTLTGGEGWGATRYHELDALESIAARHKVREAIIAMGRDEPKTIIDLVRRLRRIGITVNISSDLFDTVPQRLILDEFDGLPMARFRGKGLWSKSAPKRALDLILALVCLLMLSPILLIIALAVRLSSRGPTLYVDTMIGLNGKPFRMLKFRTMRAEVSPKAHKEYVEKFISGEVQDEEAFKMTNDSRITRVGRFLRKYSLDELPQLLNVLAGQMSLVGPRPSKPYEFERLEDWHKLRTEVRPGMTGLWQARARSEVPFDEMIALDLFYVLGGHFWLDIEILASTLKVVLLGKGGF